MTSEEDSTKLYRIKDIKFFGGARRILLQSANGPCPLLALCNVLLLRNQLKISHDARYISFAELIEMVSSHLFDANAGDVGGDSNSSRAANVRENLSSCLEILPRLNVGLDVNCKFAGVTDFEYTREMSVFDLLDIGLYHGWIVSKQEEKAYAAFAHLSYNQVVERLVACEEARQSAAGAAECPAEDPAAAKVIEEGQLIKEFMDRTASQLSYDGLLALHETVRERQLAVFFRNSHFSTMMKYNGDLYLLCTDIAFGNSHLCWERLDEVDGDTSYCDADFQVNSAANEEAAAMAAAQAVQESYLAGAASAGPPGEDAGADAMLAWQMMQEDLRQQQQETEARLQRQAQQAQQAQQAPQQGQAAGSRGGPPAGAAPSSDGGTGSAPVEGGKKGSKKGKKGGKSCSIQ
eukprot:CAMPEP_0168428576 /NCGR_PEP_ID=MMETSP0228-20121227/36929_1 /TAXON_ID=133427 /ORGANISM="Protoceratium reticulatum, Strain CCCM 535 (=CCMP 1889)" /LENGTH=405 /DNA_ID=CAMNT_0008442641 /DNA_START=30 /DNA_END=1247 /DNA_ORIENTATION=+